MNLAFFLGRTPKLSEAELRRALGIFDFPWSASRLQPAVVRVEFATGDNSEMVERAVLTALPSLQKRLGGTVKIAVLEGELSREEIKEAVTTVLLSNRRGGTMDFGLSAYGSRIDVKRMGLDIKKKLRTLQLAARVVMPKEGQELSTAQIQHNRLTGPDGCEVVLVESGGRWWIGTTRTVQDIGDYAKRDREIPVPDPRSGMLSPKLAQMMINLAVGGELGVVYDPFCGNGRVVSEALLMGLSAVGSDLDPKKVEAARSNLSWTAREYGISEGELFTHDARKPLDRPLPEGRLFIVTEPYLGKPLRAPLPVEEQEGWLAELLPLYQAFFAAWRDSERRPVRMIVAFPRPKLADGRELSLYEQLVDRLSAFGYSSSQVSDYRRPDALVGREIVEVSFQI